MFLAKLDTIDYYSRVDVNKDFSISIKDATMKQIYCADFTDEASCGFAGSETIYTMTKNVYFIIQKPNALMFSQTSGRFFTL